MSTDFPQLSKFFGLDKEKAIADSGVRNVFTPHQPISEIDLLFGRQEEVQRLVQTLNTPGQHVLLFGERGVGKSSLANVVASLLRALVERQIWVKRCDRSDTFESIVKGPLSEVGADLTLVSAIEENDASGELGPQWAKGTKAHRVVGEYKASHSLSPSTVCEAIQDLSGLLVVDEVDAIGNPEDRRKLAELIKLLSDEGSELKVMIVGIAETGTELTDAHPSTGRCLRETEVRRMRESELREIVGNGAEKTGLDFSENTILTIARMSAGYPHFTHLLALKCAEAAVVDGRQNIDVSHLRAALASAVQDAEGTLRRDYQTATRSASTDKYRVIVTAASNIATVEFSAQDLRDAIEKYSGEVISQGSLNNYLQRLMSDDGASILTRSAHGVYRFSDPRMASYARMMEGARSA